MSIESIPPSRPHPPPPSSATAALEEYHYPDAVRPDILRMVPPDGKVIGSVGCGCAGTEAELVKQGREVHGVDTSPGAIAIASRRLTSARTVRPDEIAFAPDTLDGLILADVLEHIPGAHEVLNSFAAAIRPGGWAVISVPNMRSFKVLHRLILKGEWPEDPEGIFDATHVQVMTKRRLSRWCRAAGLRPVQWFDQYAMGGSRQKLLKVLDRLTFWLFHEFCQHRLMVLCRRETQA